MFNRRGNIRNRRTRAANFERQNYRKKYKANLSYFFRSCNCREFWILILIFLNNGIGTLSLHLEFILK